MSFVFYAFAFFLHTCILPDAVVIAAPTVTYDQRQTGDRNVRIDLKDLKILAFVDSKILEDYTDYDYFYDYADFTVKPISKPTTSSSVESSSTISFNNNSSASTTLETDSADFTSTNDSPTTTTRIERSTESTTRIERSTESTTISTIEEKTETSSNKVDVVEITRSSSPLTKRKQHHRDILKIHSINNRPKFVSSG